MKKILILLVSFFIVLSIAGCSNSNSPMDTSNNAVTFNNFDDLLKWCYEDSKNVRDELGSNGGLDPFKLYKDYTLPYYPDNDDMYRKMLDFYKFSKTPIYKDSKITIYPYYLSRDGELDDCEFKVFSDGRYLTTIHVIHEVFNQDNQRIIKQYFNTPGVLVSMGYEEEYSSLFNIETIGTAEDNNSEDEKSNEGIVLINEIGDLEAIDNANTFLEVYFDGGTVGYQPIEWDYVKEIAVYKQIDGSETFEHVSSKTLKDTDRDAMVIILIDQKDYFDDFIFINPWRSADQNESEYTFDDYVIGYGGFDNSVFDKISNNYELLNSVSNPSNDN